MATVYMNEYHRISVYVADYGAVLCMFATVYPCHVIV